MCLTLYLIETPFSPFANRDDPDQAALTNQAALELPGPDLLFAHRDMIRYDPTLVDMTSKFFVLCTNVRYL